MMVSSIQCSGLKAGTFRPSLKPSAKPLCSPCLLASTRSCLPTAVCSTSYTSCSIGHASLRVPSRLWAKQQVEALKHPRPTVCRASSSASASSGASSGDQPSSTPSFAESLAKFLGNFTKLLPLWVVLSAVTAYLRPSLYTWFNTTYITNGLMFIMLGMGLTLTFQEIAGVFTKQPLLLVLGMLLQYTTLPAVGYLISRYWGLPAGLAVGVALVSCMPGGTASNVVAFLAKGDMPLSVMMTTASTMMAIFTTPLLTSILVGTLVPVDPKAMFLSVLQLVLLPVLVGTGLNQFFPSLVRVVKPFMPFTATAIVMLIMGSMIASNVAVVATSGMHIVSAVCVLHGSGFLLGYVSSKLLGLSDKVARTNSIEVGMQNTALAAVLGRIAFNDPVVAAPCVVSSIVQMAIGNLLAAYWSMTVKESD